MMGALLPQTALDAMMGLQYKFSVIVGLNILGDFTAMEGLSYEIDPFEYNEGGRNHAPVRLLNAEPGKPGQITLRTGLLATSTLHNWMNAAQIGEDYLREIFIIQFNAMYAPVRIIHLTGGFPVGWRMSDLTTDSSGMVTEELTIAYDQISVLDTGLVALAAAELVSLLTPVADAGIDPERIGNWPPDWFYEWQSKEAEEAALGTDYTKAIPTEWPLAYDEDTEVEEETVEDEYVPKTGAWQAEGGRDAVQNENPLKALAEDDEAAEEEEEADEAEEEEAEEEEVDEEAAEEEEDAEDDAYVAKVGTHDSDAKAADDDYVAEEGGWESEGGREAVQNQDDPAAEGEADAGGEGDSGGAPAEETPEDEGDDT